MRHFAPSQGLNFVLPLAHYSRISGSVPAPPGASGSASGLQRCETIALDNLYTLASLVCFQSCRSSGCCPLVATRRGYDCMRQDFMPTTSRRVACNLYITNTFSKLHIHIAELSLPPAIFYAYVGMTTLCFMARLV